MPAEAFLLNTTCQPELSADSELQGGFSAVPERVQEAETASAITQKVCAPTVAALLYSEQVAACESREKIPEPMRSKGDTRPPAAADSRPRSEILEVHLPAEPALAEGAEPISQLQTGSASAGAAQENILYT